MKTLLRITMVLVGIVSIFLMYVQLSYKQKFNVPLTGIRSSSDSSVIERGRYLVTGPTHCYSCHTNDTLKALKAKEPLIGGGTYKTLLGTFNIPNITMDKETGIGSLSDEAIARAIRYNVNHNDHAMAAFMSYNSLSDDDLTAIVSYLRTTTPVRNAVPDHDLNILGKIVKRFLIRPKLNVEVSRLKPDTTAAYGEYLSISVGQCYSCHTERDKLGKFIGKPFAGGFKWELSDGTYISPNLTPDDSTGRIYAWSAEVFIRRFRVGRVLDKSPMPWEAYQHMTDSDLRSIYRFLNTLPAVKDEPGPIFSPKSEL